MVFTRVCFEYSDITLSSKVETESFSLFLVLIGNFTPGISLTVCKPLHMYIESMTLLESFLRRLKTPASKRRFCVRIIYLNSTLILLAGNYRMLSNKWINSITGYKSTSYRTLVGDHMFNPTKSKTSCLEKETSFSLKPKALNWEAKKSIQMSIFSQVLYIIARL